MTSSRWIVERSDRPCHCRSAGWVWRLVPSVTVYVCPRHQPRAGHRLRRQIGGAGRGTRSGGMPARNGPATESGSPAGTLRVTRATRSVRDVVSLRLERPVVERGSVTDVGRPQRVFASGVSAESDARAAEIGRGLRPGGAVDRVAENTGLEARTHRQRRPVLGERGRPRIVSSLVRNVPLSRAVQPVQPDSVNGLPPLPVRITAVGCAGHRWRTALPIRSSRPRSRRGHRRPRAEQGCASRCRSRGCCRGLLEPRPGAGVGSTDLYRVAVRSPCRCPCSRCCRSRSSWN